LRADNMILFNQNNQNNQKDDEKEKAGQKEMPKHGKPGSAMNKKISRSPINPQKMFKQAKNPQSIFNNIFFYIFLMLFAYIIFSSFFQNNIGTDKKPISDLVQLINEDKVQNITAIPLKYNLKTVRNLQPKKKLLSALTIF